jgi:serine/threonine-protein phosphatase 5
MQIMKPQAAVADFKKILALEPKNETVRAQMVSTQKLIRKIEFEKVRPTQSCFAHKCLHDSFEAIEVEGEKNPVVRCREIIAEGENSSRCWKACAEISLQGDAR